MRKALWLFPVLLLSGCAAGTSPQTANVSSNANTATIVKNENSPLLSASHGAAESQPQAPHAVPPPAGSRSTDSPSGSNGGSNGRSPMEQAIDTAEMDAAIEKAARDFKQKPADAAAKKALAEAYFVRATALTEAAQYRSALGDYRRGLKLDPANAEAKEMQDQIISIFQSLKREPPKEGEEPAPAPYKKA